MIHGKTNILLFIAENITESNARRRAPGSLRTRE